MDRFAVISDIHGNLHALEAVLGEVDRLGLTEVVCLGDIVGYGPFPHKCVDLTIRCCSIIVRGNHEEAVINADREMEFNGPAREAIMWTRGVLGPLHLDALGRLAETAQEAGLARTLNEMKSVLEMTRGPASDYVIGCRMTFDLEEQT